MNQEPEQSEEPSDPDAGRNAAKKPQRFGRKSQFDDNIKREVVLAWEKQVASSTMTLEVFLAQKLGVNPDGSPVVPTSVFYGWIRKIRGEMDKKE